MLWISCCHSENFDFPFLNQGMRTTTWNRRNSAVEKYVFRVFRNVGPLTNKNPEDSSYEVESPVSSLTQIVA